MSRLLLAALAAAPPSTDAMGPVVVTHSGADALLPPWDPEAAAIEVERIAGRPKPRNRHEHRAAAARGRKE